MVLLVCVKVFIESSVSFAIIWYLRLDECFCMSRFVNCLLLLFSLMHVACGNGNFSKHDIMLADSLCKRVEVERYADIAGVYRSAVMLDSIVERNSEYDYIAKNALAYVAFMRMDYLEAVRLYEDVLRNAQCEVERLVADVGLMTLCYRTSANRRFFDFRSDALRRVARINEEVDVLPADEKVRFLRAVVELDIVSVCYFLNIGIESEMLSSIHQLEYNVQFTDDLPLRIYTRMVLNMQPSLSVAERFNALIYGLRRSNDAGLLWLSGNYRLLLAIMLRNDVVRKQLVSESYGGIAELSGDSIDTDALPRHIAMQAVADFDAYGDRFMTVETMTVAASCNTQTGQYHEALSLLEDAISVVNDYYIDNGLTYDSLPLFSLYDVNDAVEMEFMDNDSIINIAECLLSVRREAACVFSGLGDKYASDVNRNSYLDLLRTTRLNKQFERSAEIAAASANRMYVWSVVALITLIAVFVTMYLISRRWRLRNKLYSDDLKSVLDLCRLLMSSLPQELSDDDGVRSSVEDILNVNLHDFSGRTTFKIITAAGYNGSDDGFVYIFPLLHVDGSNDELLHVVCTKGLSTEKYSLLELLLPYVAVTLDEGRRIVGLADEQIQLEQLRVSYNAYLAAHKRENVLKRVSVSVVAGMKPYMDRILNELRHLSEVDACGELEQLRLKYVAELTDKLDDYNVILEHWIKMRQGVLNLNIESFSLAEIFDIISKRSASFEQKGLQFEVKESFSVVKADKALTLFMINTLTDNAGKFTPSGGRIVLEATEGDNYVEVAVSDTGIGLSQEEVELILNEKVYDASVIGSGVAAAESKGGGFGLMNCKGIIEKYRKTDSLFDVCRMDIASTRGKGSRFSFRLPKGVLRAVMLICIMLMPFSVKADAGRWDDINLLVDSVYNCNVDGRYEASLLHARRVIACLNNYYMDAIGGNDTLSFSSGHSCELYWWRNSLFPESLKEEIFYNLLDVRNEIAVAALALNDWNTYRFNNGIYSQLYRIVHEDKEIALYYEKMQRLANYRLVAVIICITLIVILLVVYASLYLRRGVIERMNAQLVLDVNRRLLRSAVSERMATAEFTQNVADDIYWGVNELLRISRVVVLLKDGENENFAVAASPVNGDVENLLYLERVCASGEGLVYAGGMKRTFPVSVVVSGKRIILGAIELAMERNLSDNELMSVELIADYAAAVIYHFTVRLASSYRNLDEVQEETERTKLEENRLHVQNMVMDNCLSVLKHETVYYPGRIRELVNGSLCGGSLSKEVWNERVSSMKELMDYYNSIFGVLSSCAMRQLDETSFRVSKVPLNEVWEYLQTFVRRRVAKASVALELLCEPTAAVACGDSDLIYFLFENLLVAALAVRVDGRLHLSAVEDGGVVRVQLFDERYRLTSEQAAELFTPSKNKITNSGIKDMEYLVAREIVRIHEDNMGRRGGRMEARESDKGVYILFTLPK